MFCPQRKKGSNAINGRCVLFGMAVFCIPDFAPSTVHVFIVLVHMIGMYYLDVFCISLHFARSLTTQLAILVSWVVMSRLQLIYFATYSNTLHRNLHHATIGINGMVDALRPLIVEHQMNSDAVAEDLDRRRHGAPSSNLIEAIRANGGTDGGFDERSRDDIEVLVNYVQRIKCMLSRSQ